MLDTQAENTISRPDRTGPALLFLVAFLALLALTVARLSLYDEGLILVGATRVLHGDLPHRDFYANYGPLQFLLLGAAFKGLGAHLIVHRALDALIKAACVTLVFLVCRRMCGRAASLLAAGLSLIWIAGCAAPGYPIWLSIALALFVVWLLDGDGDGAWRLFLAGVVSGVSFAARYDMGVATIAVVAALLLSSAWIGRRASGAFVKTAISLCGPYLLGAALVVFAILGFYYAHNMLSDFFFQVFQFGATQYPKYRSMPFPGPGASPIDFGVYLPPLIFCLFLLTLALGGPERPRAPRTLVLVAGLCFVFYFKGVVRVSALHMSGAIVFSFLIFATILDSWTRDRARIPAALRPLIVLVGLAVSGLSLVVLAQAATTSVAWLTFKTAVLHRPVEDKYTRVVSGAFLVEADEFEALKYIEDNTTRTTPLFVGAGRHDKLFVNDVLFYFLSQRAPATKWHHFDPGLQTSEPIQREIIQDLSAHKPEYVVLSTKFDNVTEPNRSATSSGVTLLDDYIVANCSPRWSGGSYKILSCP